MKWFPLVELWPSFLLPNGPVGGPGNISGGGGGAGVPGGSGSGSGGTSAPVPFGENGGFVANQFLLLIPCQIPNGPTFIAGFADNDYNDPNNGSSYSYRQEDIAVGRVPTVRRIFAVVRDLGQATLTATVTGINDLGQLVSGSKTLPIGTVGATDMLLSYFFDLQMTGYRPQLTWSRQAGGGPVSIISATMIGEVEEVSL